MSHSAPDPSVAQDTVYDGLVGHDDVAHWAFGTAFEDPLAGVDTTIPDGVDPADLAAYCLMLGDDALVACHRLSQWSSRAPDLEEDIALSNIALDLLGQARLLLARAAAADPGVVPALPDDSPVPAEDALAFFRDDTAFRNVRITEIGNGDFARTIVKVLLLVTSRLAVFERLRDSRDHVLAAVAEKGVKELAYHRDYTARWFVTLALGTEESRRRLQTALVDVWPLRDELFRAHPVETRLAEAGVGVDPATVRSEADDVLRQVLDAADVAWPEDRHRAGVRGLLGRDGMHTEELSLLLTEMQVVARAHPSGRW